MAKSLDDFRALYKGNVSSQSQPAVSGAPEDLKSFRALYQPPRAGLITTLTPEGMAFWQEHAKDKHTPSNPYVVSDSEGQVDDWATFVKSQAAVSGAIGSAAAPAAAVPARRGSVQKPGAMQYTDTATGGGATEMRRGVEATRRAAERAALERELAQILSTEGYIYDPDEANRVAARRGEVSARLRELDALDRQDADAAHEAEVNAALDQARAVSGSVDPMAGEALYGARTAVRDAEGKSAFQNWLEVLGYSLESMQQATAGNVAPVEHAEAAADAASRARDAKERYDAAAEAIDWPGREELIAELQRLEKLDRGETNPALTQRIDEVRAAIEEGDRAAGNGVRAYTGKDRAGEIVESVGKGIGAAGVGAYAGLSRLGEMLAMQAAQEQDMSLGGMLAGSNLSEAAADTFADEATTDAYKQLDETAAKLGAEAQAALQTAKEGIGVVGRVGVDIAQNLLEMGFDVGVSAFTGAPVLASMFLRVFGQSYNEAGVQTDSPLQRVSYGLTKAGIEVATEKMFDVFGVLGGGSMDGKVRALVRRLSENDVGRGLLIVLAEAQGEGLEEIVSGLLDPVAGLILGQGWQGEDWEDIAYSYLIGATIGLLGETTKLTSGQVTRDVAQMRAADGFQHQLTEAGTAETVARSTADLMAREAFGEELNEEERAAVESTPEAEKIRTENRAAVLESIILDETEDAPEGGVDEKAAQELAGVLANGYQSDGTGARVKVRAAVEAYTMGREGAVAIEEARGQSENGTKISDEQFRAAYELGRRALDVEEGRVADTSTEDGRAALRADLAALGEYAQDAAAVYEDGQNLDRFVPAMLMAANFAADGADVDTLVESARADGKGVLGTLTSAQVEAAKQIGERLRADRAENTAAREAVFTRLRETTSGKAFTPGTLTFLEQEGTAAGRHYRPVGQNLSRTQRAVVSIAGEIAYTTGLDIRVADFGRGVGGAYIPGNGGVLYLNIAAEWDGKNVSIASLSHELTHWLQEYAPEKYAQLKRIIAEEMSRDPALFRTIFGERAAKQPNLKPEEITDEMAANACQVILADGEAVQRIVEERRSFAEKLRDLIFRIIDDLKAAFAEFHAVDGFPLMQEVKAAEGALDEMREMWLAAFDEASANLQAEKAAGQASVNEAETAQSADSSAAEADTSKAESSKNAAPEDGEAQLQTWGSALVYNDRAIVSEQTLDKWLDDYAASNPNYAQAYIAYMEPLDFLRMTTSGYASRETIREQAKGMTVQNALDFSKGQPIQLIIDSETGKVEGHEGRHRMAALAAKGIYKVPVLLFDYKTKYSKTALEELTLTGQDFRREGENSATARIRDVQPLSRGNRDAVAERFSRKGAKERVYENAGYQTAEFQLFDDTSDDTAEEARGRAAAYARIQSENVILAETVEALRNFNTKQGKTIEALQKKLSITKTPETRLGDARKLARQLLKEHSSRADVERLTQELKALGDYILQTETAKLDENEIKSRARAIAREIVEQSRELSVEAIESYVPVWEALKGKKFSIDETALGDVAEDFETLRKRLFGTVTLTRRAANTRESREGYLSVDTLYGNLQTEFGEGMFPESANEGEQLNTIVAALDAAKGVEVNPYEQYMGEVTEEIANQIAQDALSGVLRAEAPTTADRQRARVKQLQERIKALKAEGKLAEREVGTLYNTIYDLSMQLDRAESRYKTLKKGSARRIADLKADVARATEREAKRLAKIERKKERWATLVEERAELGKAYKSQMFDKGGDRAAGKETLAAMRALDEKIEDAARDLLQNEDVLSSLLNRERASAVKREAKNARKRYERLAERAKERRRNTASRRKIRRLMADLQRMLEHPTENRHVPPELTKATLDLLSMIDLNTGESSAEKVSRHVAALRLLYERYKVEKGEASPYSGVYDESVSQMLDELAKNIGETTLQKMTEQQLDAVYRTLRAMVHIIETANKVRIGQQEREAYELSVSATKATRSIGKEQKGLLREHLIPAHLRADVAFDRFGGFIKASAWNQLARMLNDGQLKQTRLKMELGLPFAELFQNQKALQDYTAQKWDGKIDKSKLVDIGLKDADGNAVPVTRDFMVAIYLDLLNADNRRHFIRGGKTVPNFEAFYAGRVKDSYGLGSTRIPGIAAQLAEARDAVEKAKDEGRAENGGRYERKKFEGTEIGARVEQVEATLDALLDEGERRADEVQENIEKQLTDYDRAWIKAIQQLMDVDSKRELNRTTMEVYGIEKATVPGYFPIYTDKAFVDKPMEAVMHDMSLENVGFMKERVQSGNPTYAVGSVWAVTQQIERVAQYCGLMPAVRNFNKVYNKTQRGYNDSMRKALEETFGTSGTDYVENLLADLQGGRHVKGTLLDTIFTALRGNLARTTLTLNARVALAQAASYPTAAAELGYKPLAKALAHGGKDGLVLSRADQELIAKWSPLLWYRMQGYAMPETGDIQGSTKAEDRLWRKLRYVTGWIQAVDGATVGRLWYAAEYWVQEHKPTLEKGTDAYYEAVAEKFNAVVEKTQPNYTTMQRAAILREPSTTVKALTMFMTQRMQNFNILYDAWGRYNRTKHDLANKRNGVTEDDLREARTDWARAASSQLAQAAVFVAFKLFADVLLRNLKKYRDKETGDITKKSVSAALLDAFGDALVGTMLLGSETYGFLKALLGKQKWYGISIGGLDSLNDLAESVVNLSNAAVDPSDPKSVKAYGKKWLTLGSNLAQALGIPLPNAMKIMDALKNYAIDGAKGRFLSYEAGFERTTAQNTEKLIRALESGDETAIREAAAAFESEKDALSKVKTRVKEDVQDGERTAEDAEALLVTAGMDKNDAFFAAQSMETGDEGRYTAVKRAAFAGDKSGFKAALQDLTSHGYKQKDVYGEVKSLVKSAYYGNDLSETEKEITGGKALTDAQARKMLHDYAGFSVDEANDLVAKWSEERAFIKKHGEEFTRYDLSVAQARYYYETAKSSVTMREYADQVARYGLDLVKAYYGSEGKDGFAVSGLSFEQYEAYREGRAQCSGKTKQAQIIALIDSLPISREQKDWLFLKDYGKSSLSKTPWH